MILSKGDLKKCLSSGDLVIKPFDENSLGPCDINLHISKNYARIRDSQQTLDLCGDINDEFIDNKYFIVEQNEEYVIRPNEHLLIESLEYFEVPTYLTVLIGLRSTFSRLGFSTPPTLIDAGFKGKIVFHLIGTSYPTRLYAGMAIFRAVFMHVSSGAQAYQGKYQDQTGIVLPKGDPMWKQNR